MTLMRYQVPQFIEVEDKIFGPLTLKQFIYLIGGAGISFVIWQFLPLIIAIFFILPIAGLSLGLAFYKVNNRPLINTIEYATKYGAGNKLYLWDTNRKSVKKSGDEDTKVPSKSQLTVPNLSQSKIRDIAWSLDIKENINQQ